MTNQRQRPKIALIGYRLSGGGSERVMANLSLFFEAQNIEVHNIIVLDEITFPHAGTVFNLGKLKNESNGLYNKWIRLKAIKKYLDENNFDFIIDFRFRTKLLQELLLARCIYKAPTIFTVHSFRINHYMPDNSFFTRWMYGSCLANVVITEKVKAIIEEKHQLQNVITISNPILIEDIQKQSKEILEIDFDYIVAAGRLEDKVKQFDVLIECYAKSELPNKNIHLILVGDGDLKTDFIALSKTLSVEKFVHFVGYQVNPFKYFKNAKFTVLSSANEGLPLVLLESLACKTPVVAFDCETGPAEIIQHTENGLLVENQNKEKLVEAMNLMASDSELYVNCRKNALKSVQRFSLEHIGRKWLQLMKI